MFTTADHEYMTLALRLAEKGLFSTTPNPRVGCVLVNHGKIIGQGAHLKAGEPHAEIIALGDAKQHFPDLIKGADVFVTLEPCSHFGLTPPCANALIDAGVKRVVVAMQDPNPKVAGSGLAQLSHAGILVQSGLMEVEAQALNAGFINRMTQNRPFVRLKIAASLDGGTALANGESQWITGESARLDVQHWRARSCAILTGSGTVIADDPQMNVRHIQGARQPLRVIVDSQLRISPEAKILVGSNTLIAYAKDTQQHADKLTHLQATLLNIPGNDGRVCLKALLSHLASLGINELMVEAGQTLNGALLADDLVDELIIYYAPLLLGSNARGMLAIPALQSMQDRLALKLIDVRQFGRDLRVIARPIRR